MLKQAKLDTGRWLIFTAFLTLTTNHVLAFDEIYFRQFNLFYKWFSEYNSVYFFMLENLYVNLCGQFVI